MKFNQLKLVSLVVVLSFFTACKSSEETKKEEKSTTNKKPNIVFVLVDDLGWADVGFNGSKYFETPNLDALAEKSLVLNNAYMYPTCSPTRTAIFTGKQSFRTGVYTVPVLEKGTDQENIFSRWTVGKEHPIYTEPMAKVGYKSIHLGKYHIVGPNPLEELKMDFPIKQKLTQPDPGVYQWAEVHKTPEVQQYYPEGRGFIKNVGGTYRGDPALEVNGYKSVSGGYWAPFSNPFIEQKPDDNWLTDRLTDDAIEFIGEHKEDPFLINLNFYAVHRPIRARSEELLQKYLNKPVDSVTGQGGIGVNQKIKEKMAGYASMVESVDENIGRVVDYLEKNGLRENTMIIVTSDNGQNGNTSSNKLLRGSKGYIYEGGIKVPMLINWPNKITPRRSDAAVTCLDIFPTLMDVAGIDDYTGVLDGDSVTEIFEKDSKLFQERPLFWQINSQWKHGTCSVIRKGNHKLIQWLSTGKLELYNLITDVTESNNIAEVETETTKNMLAELVEWRKENKVPLPPNSVLNF